MSRLSKYIEVEEAVDRIYQIRPKRIDSDYQRGIAVGMNLAKLVIEEVPTADVVPVVRCKDCKHRRGDGFCKKYQRNIDGSATMWFAPDDDWFCADGEKVNDNA